MGHASSETGLMLHRHSMKLLHFAFVGAFFQQPAPASNGHLHSLHVLDGTKKNDILRLDVRGDKYELKRDYIPKSTFQKIKNLEVPGTECIVVDRDAHAFKYVYGFLRHGCLPKDSAGLLPMDPILLDKVKQEADYFCVSALNKECERASYIPYNGVVDLKREFVFKFRCCEPVEPLFHAPNYYELRNAIRNLWVPVCSADEIFMQFSSKAVSDIVNHVRARAVAAPGSPTLELPGDSPDLRSMLGDVTQTRIGPLEPGAKPVYCLRSVEIHTAGAKYADRSCHDTNQNETHIGVLVGTLDSHFTGGEMQVAYDGQIVNLHPETKWAAMHRNCSYSMQRVMSGTRVCLVYDIHRAPPHSKVDYNYAWTTRRHYPIMRIAPEPALKTRLFKELNSALKDFNSVTIGLQHVYSADGTIPENLQKSDRVLYDALCEEYNVTIVAATIDRGTAGFYNQAIVDKVLAGVPARSDEWYTEERDYADMLITPLDLSESQVLDGRTYDRHGDWEWEDLHLISGLRLTRRGV